MSTDGILRFQNTKKATFVGPTSNISFDTVNSSLGIGVTGDDVPSSNLYITGNAYVSSNLALGGVLTMGTVNVVARHSLQAVTEVGNATSVTTEFTNPTTSLVASGNVEVAKELTVSGNAEVGTANLFVDTVNSRVGIGTTEPSGQLELVGDSTTQEYPPGPMNDYDTLIPGHGIFKVYSSSDYGQTPYRSWNAFDKTIISGSNGWASKDNSWLNDGTTTPVSSLAANFGGTDCHWIALQLPYAIKPTLVTLQARNDGQVPGEVPAEGRIYGSRDGVTWNQIRTYDIRTEVGTLQPSTNNTAISITLNTNEYYTHLLLTVDERYGGSGTTARWTAIGELRYFGTPGPTTLDKGSLSLTRSLDVPRISRYDVDTETPRPEKLMVDFDTTVNSSPTDISGNGNHGTFLSNASYSSPDKAFKFDGSGDAIYLAKDTNLPTGDAIYTLSCWLKLDSTQTSIDQSILYFGSAWAANELAGMRIVGGNKVGGDIGSTQYHTTNAVIVPERWYHIVVVKRGTGVTPAQGASDSYMRIYVDGVQITNITKNGSDRTQGIGVVDRISIGSSFSGNVGSFNESVNGCISKPQIWNVALETSEVQKLYRLGRTGRSMVITDTAVGIGKAPEAQLDVKGTVAVRGNLTAFDRVGVGTTSPTTNLDVNGSFKVNGPHSYSGRPVAVVGRAVAPSGRSYLGVYTFNAVLYNDGNIYSTSNGRFTIPTGWDGYYLLAFTGLGGVNETAPNTRWRVNGGDLQWGGAHVNLGSGVNFGTANARLGLSTSLVYYLNANDYVQLAVVHGSLYGDATVHSTATVMYLGGN